MNSNLELDSDSHDGYSEICDAERPESENSMTLLQKIQFHSLKSLFMAAHLSLALHLLLHHISCINKYIYIYYYIKCQYHTYLAELYKNPTKKTISKHLLLQDYGAASVCPL